jgi:hypothetical protein
MISEMLRKKMRFLFFTTLGVVVISSCSSSNILRLYPEPPLLSSETARLHLFDGESRYRTSSECVLKLAIQEFDGKKPSDGYETLEFLPGPHSVTVDFQPFMTGGIRVIHFDTKAGGEYIFGCGMDYSLGEWTAEVLDRVTGDKVSSRDKKNK